jgi:hypothetical protein
MPVNFLLIESLHRFHAYYGDEFRIECPIGSGKYVSLADAAEEVSRRLCALFLRGPDGRRPVLGPPPPPGRPDFQDDPLFYEYFHGDTGRGCGAAHQTGWSALVASLLHPHPGRGRLSVENIEEDPVADAAEVAS